VFVPTLVDDDENPFLGVSPFVHVKPKVPNVETCHRQSVIIGCPDLSFELLGLTPSRDIQSVRLVRRSL
jgi:hypothetical protein